MLENCKSAQEKWGGVSDIIDRWLMDRQDMLVHYCRLSDLLEQQEENAICGPSLQRLCQIMVDYISAGHFEVYDQLVQEGRDFDDKAGLKSAGESFKKIDSSTEYILDFNDKYQETDDLDSLLSDLSILGETLANRFEAEDSMIEVLHVSHKDKIAS